MDRKLHLINHLYGEEAEGTPPLSDLLADAELQDEYRALSEVRFALDRRARQRPDRSVVDAIVAEAAPRELPSRSLPWTDRAPLQLVRRHRRMTMSAIAMAAALALTVWMQPWSSAPDQVASVPQSARADLADAEPDLAPPESLLRSLPPAPTLAAAAEPSEWDEGRDIRQLSRRIDRLRAAGELEWDEPAVPLEMLPEDAQRRLLQASSPR